MNPTYLAHTIKGVEDITLAELKDKLAEFILIDTKPKVISLKTSTAITEFPFFQTLDDLSILVSTTKTDSNLTNQDVLSVLDSCDFNEIHEFLGKSRKLDKTFSLTLTYYKNREIDREKLRDQIAKSISAKYGLAYTFMSHQNFDIRLIIEPRQLYVAVKAFPTSLFFRDYKKASQPGALRPSIAGAMVYETLGKTKSMKVADNFCGSATILCEAALMGHLPFGGDIDPESVEIAKTNISTINPNLARNIKPLDAVKSPWPDNYFDAAISNLPWGRQSKTNSITRLYAGLIKEYARILKPESKICLLTTRPEIARKYLKQEFPSLILAEYALGFLGESPTMLVGAKVKSPPYSPYAKTFIRTPISSSKPEKAFSPTKTMG